MNRILVFGLVALAAGCETPGSANVYADPTSELRVLVGEQFSIEAQSECRDGFHWRAIPGDSAIVKLTTQAELVRAASGPGIGANVCSHDVFDFNALRQGRTNVVLESFRPEPVGEPTVQRRMEYRVVVY